MARQKTEKYVRPLPEVREIILERARASRNPCEFIKPEDVEQAFAQLSTLDRDAWAEAFSVLARPYEGKAHEAEAAGDQATAKENYLRAYGCYRLARYPTLNSPRKKEAYRRSQECFLKAARYFVPPVQRVEMSFQGRPGEGRVIVGYLRRPPGRGLLPLVILWGGIDSFKEDRPTDLYVNRNLATLSIDMPGVGDAPVTGSEDAERMWDAVFDWADLRSDIDSTRIAVVGGSTGGYWATKLAHTHRTRIRAAVNHGGPAHLAFQPDWIEQAERGEYPLELGDTIAFAFGLRTFEEWLQEAPRFSLLTLGILDQPCAPLLCVNGVHDSIFPISDHYLLLEHGDPKTARFFQAGHMGGPDANRVIVDWVTKSLTA